MRAAAQLLLNLLQREGARTDYKNGNKLPSLLAYVAHERAANAYLNRRPVHCCQNNVEEDVPVRRTGWLTAASWHLKLQL
eukprot:6159288-Amphidinium_carterae.1